MYALKVPPNQTKSDFTTKRAMGIMFIASILCFCLSISFSYNTPGYTVVAFVIACIYGIFIIFDVQAIAGGRYVELSLDDYVLAALMLYIDIIGLLIYLMALLGKKK